MNIKELKDIVLTSLNDGKATNINVYDVKDITSMSDYILIASGRSRIQVTRKNGVQTLGIEGKTEGEWVLVDLGDIIIHIMHPDSREYYQLEKLWG